MALYGKKSVFLSFYFLCHIPLNGINQSAQARQKLGMKLKLNFLAFRKCFRYLKYTEFKNTLQTIYDELYLTAVR